MNRKTFLHHSGIIGAFLQTADLSAPNNRWYHPSLRYACDWLQHNNPYLMAYHSLASRLITSTSNSHLSPIVWPQAMHISDEGSTPSGNFSDIVMPSYVFPDEIHNEEEKILSRAYMESEPRGYKEIIPGQCTQHSR